MDLFRVGLDISNKHMSKCIIVNPKSLFNLVESNFLLIKKQENAANSFKVTPS